MVNAESMLCFGEQSFSNVFLISLFISDVGYLWAAGSGGKFCLLRYFIVFQNFGKRILAKAYDLK